MLADTDQFIQCYTTQFGQSICLLYVYSFVCLFVCLFVCYCRMLSEYGMECVWCVNFYDLFEEYSEDDKFMELAFKMKAFEKNTVLVETR